MGYGPSKPTKRPSTSWTSLSTWAKAPTRPSQSLTPHYNTSTATATTQQWPQRTYPPASTNDCHPFHPTKHPLTKPPFHIKKHSTNTDIGTLCSTNHLQLNSSKHIDDTADNFKDSKTYNFRQRNICPLNGNCLQSSLAIKPPSHVRTITPLKHTSDIQKTNSRLDTENTLHHSDTQNTETRLNSANIFGP